MHFLAHYQIYQIVRLPKLYGLAIMNACVHSPKLSPKLIPPDRNRAGDLEICSELYSLTLYQLSYGWVSDGELSTQLILAVPFPQIQPILIPDSRPTGNRYRYSVTVGSTTNLYCLHYWRVDTRIVSAISCFGPRVPRWQKWQTFEVFRSRLYGAFFRSIYRPTVRILHQYQERDRRRYTRKSSFILGSQWRHHLGNIRCHSPSF
jgi:hypothetical protein